MTRQKSFNEQEILAEIGHLFWRKGYIATSIDDICELVSLKRTSIYHAYGDKATLFRKAMDWYVSEILPDGMQLLKGEQAVSDELHKLFHYFFRLQHDHIVSQGCLITTSVIELQHSEPEIFEYVHIQMERISDNLHHYLNQAKSDGRLSANVDVDALSEYVSTVLLGLRVQTRVSRGNLDLDSILALAVQPILALENPVGKKKA